MVVTPICGFGMTDEFFAKMENFIDPATAAWIGGYGVQTFWLAEDSTRTGNP